MYLLFLIFLPIVLSFNNYFVIDNGNYNLFLIENVKKINIRYLWKDIEQYKHNYNFKQISNDINNAILYDKNLSISIRTGEYTPEWLKKECTNLSFIVGPHNDKCENITLCVPWDDIYISSFQMLLVELYNFIFENYGLNNNIEILKITGINEKTEELRLPSTNKSYILNNCILSNDTFIWEKVNYKNYYILNVFDIFISEFAKFKNLNIKLTLEILDNNAFPFNNNNTMYILIKYKNIIDYIQWDGLNSIKQANIMNYLYNNGYNISWQTNQFLGIEYGTGCLSDKVQNAVRCQKKTYFELLNNGFNGKYIEIWDINFIEFF